MFFDFGGATVARRVFDLASALVHRLASDVSPCHVPELVDAYQETAGVRPDPEEIDALPLLGASVAIHYEICGWMPERPLRRAADRLLLMAEAGRGDVVTI